MQSLRKLNTTNDYPLISFYAAVSNFSLLSLVSLILASNYIAIIINATPYL